MPRALLVCLALVLMPRGARAELESDVRALGAAWRPLGRVSQLEPQFVERGQPLPIFLPLAHLDPRSPSCTTLAVLGPPSLHFVLHVASPAATGPEPALVSSVAGALELTRCGRDKALLSWVLLEMRSPRGLVELLVASATEPLPSLLGVLPRRDPGPIALPPALDGPPEAPPEAAGKQLLRLKQRAQADNAVVFEKIDLPIGPAGSGVVPLELETGCHELTLLDAGRSDAGSPEFDLDLGDALDHVATAAPDESVEASLLCVERPTQAWLRVAHARLDPVEVAHARWDLPRGLPAGWAPSVRAGAARVLYRHHFSPDAEPVYQSLGVQGSTLLPVELEPDACYVALAVPVHGRAQFLAIAARTEGSGVESHEQQDVAGAVTAFCAGGATRARIEVESRGAALAWLVALWEMGRAPPGLVDE